MNNVIDLVKRRIDSAIAHGRVPLSTTHVDSVDSVPITERVRRIKASLERINILMSEIRKGRENGSTTDK